MLNNQEISKKNNLVEEKLINTLSTKDNDTLYNNLRLCVNYVDYFVSFEEYFSNDNKLYIEDFKEFLKKYTSNYNEKAFIHVNNMFTSKRGSMRNVEYLSLMIECFDEAIVNFAKEMLKENL